MPLADHIHTHHREALVLRQIELAQPWRRPRGIGAGYTIRIALIPFPAGGGIPKTQRLLPLDAAGIDRSTQGSEQFLRRLTPVAPGQEGWQLQAVLQMHAAGQSQECVHEAIATEAEKGRARGARKVARTYHSQPLTNQHRLGGNDQAAFQHGHHQTFPAPGV